MSVFANKLLPQVKLTLRETSDEFDQEILSYIDTCATDLQTAGIFSLYFDASLLDWECDPQILQAVRWYCLANYGLYNSDSEKYFKAYSSLKATLCTQSKYRKEFGSSSPSGFEEILRSLREQIAALSELVSSMEDQLSKKVDTLPIPEVQSAYVINSEGSHIGIPVSAEAQAGVIVQRTDRGTVQTTMPEEDEDCVPLSFFNQTVGNVNLVLDQLYNGG